MPNGLQAVVRDANGVPTPFPIALVDRIYSEESGGTLWVWPPPLSNRGIRRDCPGEFSGTLPVPDTVTQVVDMGRRNLGQVCVLPSAKLIFYSWRRELVATC